MYDVICILISASMSNCETTPITTVKTSGHKNVCLRSHIIMMQTTIGHEYNIREQVNITMVNTIEKSHVQNYRNMLKLISELNTVFESP